MGDLGKHNAGIDMLKSASSVGTLTSAYTLANSGILDISRSSYISLGVNYTTGSGETANTFLLKYEVANKNNVGSISGPTLAFVDSDPDTITDSGNAFLTSGFGAGQKIIVSGASTAANNTGLTIDSVAAGTITLISTDTLTAETAAANVSIESVQGLWYRLHTAGTSAGAVTISSREDTFTQAASAGAYDRFNVELTGLGAWDYLRVWVKEGGVGSNYGSYWIEANILGR